MVIKHKTSRTHNTKKLVGGRTLKEIMNNKLALNADRASRKASLRSNAERILSKHTLSKKRDASLHQALLMHSMSEPRIHKKYNNLKQPIEEEYMRRFEELKAEYDAEMQRLADESAAVNHKLKNPINLPPTKRKRTKSNNP